VNIYKYLDRIRSSFWFVPVVMAAGAVGLALGTVAVDERAAGAGIPWVYTGGAEGASAVLGTIAGSMITIAGVVFSLTLVALSLASSQLGPRVLASFMRDRTVQVVLGTFIATFLYCLLVLRTVRRVEENAFVPQISVTLALVFAVLSLGVLIYFIHHVSVSIQADEIISRISAELAGGIRQMFPEQIGSDGPGYGTDPSSAGLPPGFDREAREIPASRDGYIQIIDAKALMQLAARHNLVMRLSRRPGHYVIAGTALARVWPGERIDEDLHSELNAAFVVGGRRSPAQDVEFAVNQLVEIAVRALSPGVNDPFTAIACVDRIGSALCQFARRDLPSPYRVDENGVLRIVADAPTFAAIADAALNQIRQNSRSTASVTIRLLETVAVVASCLQRQEDRQTMRHHAEMIVRGAREGIPEESDLRDIEQRFAAVLQALVPSPR